MSVSPVGAAVAVALLLSGPTGCRRPPPTTLPEIEAAQLALPAVFLTVDGEEVIAPGDRSDVVVAPRSRTPAFRAYTCTNPACPNRDRGRAGRPALFIWADPLWRVDERGELVYDVAADRAGEIVRRGGDPEPTCPGCLAHRDRDRETPETRQRYRDWTARYELPETLARRAELDEAYRRRLEATGRRPAGR